MEDAIFSEHVTTTSYYRNEKTIANFYRGRPIEIFLDGDGQGICIYQVSALDPISLVLGSLGIYSLCFVDALTE